MLSKSIAAILFGIISSHLVSLSNAFAIDKKVIVSVYSYSGGSGKESTAAQGITSGQRWKLNLRQEGKNKDMGNGKFLSFNFGGKKL